MNVVYYSSDFFSEMCGVSIASLCEHNRDANCISFYIIEDQISQKSKTRIENIALKYKRDLFFIRMPSQVELYPDVIVNLGRTYARMALGDLLPSHIDKILSLDSDTLVLDTLTEMYETSFEPHEYVAGVYDCVGSAIQKGVLNASDKLQYCNAGMYLIDMNKWRSENIGTQLLNAVLENKEGKKPIYFLEQDIMNLCFQGHIKLLHPRYNLLTSIALFSYTETIYMKKPVSYYNENYYNTAKNTPTLIHATTCFFVKKRMWVRKSDHPYAPTYQRYRDKTPWREDPQIPDKRKLVKRIYAQFWHCMPRNCAIKVASFAINRARPAYARITAKINHPTVANNQ